MNRNVQSNYCSYYTKLKFTIEACFIQTTATSTTGDTIQSKSQMFFSKEREPNTSQ